MIQPYNWSGAVSMLPGQLPFTVQFRITGVVPSRKRPWPYESKTRGLPHAVSFWQSLLAGLGKTP